MWRALNEDTAGSLPAEPSRQLAPLEALAAIPEEEIWLAKQKSAQTRRAYRLDVQHFMRALGITTTAALRQVDHRAIIAWERMQREQEGARRFHCAPTPGGPFQPVQAPGETRGGDPSRSMRPAGWTRTPSTWSVQCWSMACVSDITETRD
jgi:Phage integrase, N-terminal SAM-like domain